MNAVVGFGGQFELAARVVLAKLSTLEWIRVADPEAGVADDFQFKSGPRRHALQVKWSQSAGSFTWSDLTSGEGGKPGLLAKLADAWQRLRPLSSDPLTVYLCTNNHASNSPSTGKTPIALASAPGPRSMAAFVVRSFEPVQAKVRGGTTLWSNLAQLPEVVQWAPVWTRMRELTGLTADEFASFVGDFEMVFGLQLADPLVRPDQDPTDREVQHLAQTLQNIVRDDARQVHLTRDQLMDRLEWSERLRYRHPHQFPIPAVYTTNEAARAGLETALGQLTRGYIALLGPAGSGKSTLLTSLRLHGHVARYYAFVPDAPDPLSSRGEAESYLHDVSLALEESGLPRQGVGNDLPSQRSVLLRQIDAAGLRWKDHEERTVIVIDGLDHIPREQRPSRSLLEELPAPTALPDGVFVVLGTQTTSILPAVVRTALDQDGRTVPLPPLSNDEVERVVVIAGLDSWLYPGQVAKVAEASEGHPLALTYILQELTALESSEPDLPGRRERADRLLADASGYGGNIESRYQGYLQAIGTDHHVLDLLGLVARLRVPVNMDWLLTWADSYAVSAFAEQAYTFFRRSGTNWQFIHNSFRRFLEDQTAKVADEVDETRNLLFHQRLADICANSEDWSLYRDEEMAHRFLANQHDRVLTLATPARLRESLLQLRPSTTVRDHALIALRSATLIDDSRSFLLMLMFLNELHLRSFVLETDKYASAVFSFDPQLALEHVVRGGRLRIELGPAIELAVAFAAEGDVSAAQHIVRTCGGLAGLANNTSLSPNVVADWAEVTWRLSGLEAVLAELDHHLPAPKPYTAPLPASTDSTRREEIEQDIDTAACRNWAHARCCNLLTEIRDDEALDRLLSLIDVQASASWRGLARYVRAKTASQDRVPSEVMRWVREITAIDAEKIIPDEEEGDDEDLTANRSTHALPLNIRAAAVELLIRNGFHDEPEVVQLLPAGTAAAWPSSLYGQHGLDPFSTLISLTCIRHVLPDPAGLDPMPPGKWSSSGDPGTERLLRAIRALAEIEGRQLAAAVGLGETSTVAAHAGPILRLLEVPSDQTRDWTGWYNVQDVAPDLFSRVVRLAAASDPGAKFMRLLEMFDEAWTIPERAQYWTPTQQQAVIIAAINAGPEAREWALERLHRLDGMVDTQSHDPHSRVSNWLKQSQTWSAAGEPHLARRSAQSAVLASLGIDSSDKDYQLVEWLAWLRAAIEQGELTSVEFSETVRRYASRIASAASSGSRQVEAAAEELISLIFPRDVSLGCELAEWLCDSGALGEAHAIQAVVLAACRHPDIPIVIGVAAATELLYPIIPEPTSGISKAVSTRKNEDPEAVAALSQATRLWTVSQERADTTDAVDAEQGHEAAQGVSTPSTDTSPPVVTIGALLTHLRKSATIADSPEGGWDKAVTRTAPSSVPVGMARALLEEGKRLGLNGIALGELVALGARSGEIEGAVKTLTDALSRMPAYGWLRHYDGGTRLALFASALRDRNPSLVQVARTDLATSLATGALSGQMSPDHIRRIVDLVAGPDTVARAWPDIEEYLDVAAPADTGMPPSATGKTVAPFMAFANWVTSYLGHPIRTLDFGARRALQLICGRDEAVGQLALARAIRRGGWDAEAAILAMITARPADRVSSLLPELTVAVQQVAIGDDGLCRDLARRLAHIHDVALPEPKRRSLPGSYGLSLPPLPDRRPPELDRRGTPHLDPNDPQQMVAPFDEPLRWLARLAELEESAVLYRAATIATASDQRWIRGGHRAHASLLKGRQQKHSHRPWAYMAGRRALGNVIAELDDAGALGVLPKLPSYYLRLVDERLSGIEPFPLPSWVPLPWRPANTRDYDTSGWCSEVSQAAAHYKDEYSSTTTYVLAECGEWRSLEWGRPEEERRIYASHRTASATELLDESSAWEESLADALRYPHQPDLDWNHQELILRGHEHWTDAPHTTWLALHPAVGHSIGWTPSPEILFTWTGSDGDWRARTVLFVRGQLTHQPPMSAACTETWQVQLSEKGYSELKSNFPFLRRELQVTRTLPQSRRENRLAQTLSHRVELVDTAT
ncbi:ATP-binding protein [Rhodococcus sp. USK13]|uniref:ATP-binding protein n=1 Tax=Rhodococcus sp. USK13 TaxID=2806442 RepID=UPI001BD03EFF|nr:ATP-binding protein [Rhodococcus sp. USK13]